MQPNSNYEHIRIHEIQDQVYAKTHQLNEHPAKQSRAEQLLRGVQCEVLVKGLGDGQEVYLELATGTGNADVAGKNRARGGATGTRSSWLAWLTHHLTH